jgi:cytochrome P450
MFHEMLQSDLSEEEKSVNRLGDEALNVVGAGLTTTAWALCNAAFYIIHNPKIQATLQAELRVAFPDPKDMSFAQLEKMQYLRGCIREGIRFSHGVSARNPRVMHTVTTYKSWDIPAGVPVSMSARDVHFDERIYADPDDFKPERWMDNPRALDGRPLNHYFVAFGKGSRACLGIK